MSNIIDAICNLIKYRSNDLANYQNIHNRINSLGDSLENFIADIFSHTLFENNEQTKLTKQEKIFSYKGNNSNPPDFMLRNGDAIEVKKIENQNSSIALNSSYPKAKLYSNSSMITTFCKNCEIWEEKDIIYIVGVVASNKIKSLCFIYGEDYAAEAEIYERIKTTIKSGVESIEGTKFTKTKELGRVNQVDPLGITNLRIRGMWHIENPFKVFEYVFKRDSNKNFSFFCIINNDKFETFSNKSKLLTLIEEIGEAKISDIFIKNPNNPANLKQAKLISYEF